MTTEHQDLARSLVFVRNKGRAFRLRKLYKEASELLKHSCLPATFLSV